MYGIGQHNIVKQLSSNKKRKKKKKFIDCSLQLSLFFLREINSTRERSKAPSITEQKYWL